MKTPAVQEGTQVYGLIGDPVAHSVSPAMHNAAFQKLGLNCFYAPFRVAPADLAEAVAGLRALNVRGFNVTIPHKVAVMRCLDEVDPLVEDLGAVNCVVNQAGYLKGYNTDAGGFLRALRGAGFELAGKTIAVLGAGGAGRAIAFILADKGADLILLNRHRESAEKLCARLSGRFRREFRANDLSAASLRESLKEADLVVNATSLGMTPVEDISPVPARLLRKRQTVFDVVYNPLETRLLRDAQKKGARVIGGIEMLVWQGAVAFELWTGRKAPVETMRRAAIQALGKDEN